VVWRVLATLAAAAAARAQLVTTDAGVISPGLVVVKERIEWSVREDAEELRATTGVAFAPERRLQLDFLLPYVSRRVDVPAGTGSLRGLQDGVGDAEVGAKWALVRDDERMRSDRVSVLADLRLPTGEDDTRVDGVDLGPRAGLGLGTWGGALGLGYSLVRDQHRAAIALRGEAFATDDGFAPGEALTLDAAWWLRIAPREFSPEQESTEWRGVVEVLGRWQADDELGGVDAGNGGTEWQLVLGLQANLGIATALEGGVIFPLSDSTDSPFGELRRGFLLSFRMLF
jgi:hypothetical protein